MTTLIEKIRKIFLKSYKLTDENQLSIIKVDFDMLDTKIQHSLSVYLKSLKIGCTINSYNNSMRLLNTSPGKNKINDVSTYKYKTLFSLRKNIVERLLVLTVPSTQEEKGNVMYLPLFLLHYALPQLQQLVNEWESTSEEDLGNIIDDNPFIDYAEVVNEEDDVHCILGKGEYCHSFSNTTDSNNEIFSDKERISSVFKDSIDTLREQRPTLANTLSPATPIFYNYFIWSPHGLEAFSVEKIPRHNFYSVETGITVVSNPGRLLDLSKISKLIDETHILFIPREVEVLKTGRISGEPPRFKSIFHLSIASDSNLKHISGWLFSENYINRLTIPSKVETIGAFSFYSVCTNHYEPPIREIAFYQNQSLKKIGDFAFYTTDTYLSQDTKFRRKIIPFLPESLEEIGNFAFATGQAISSYDRIEWAKCRSEGRDLKQLLIKRLFNTFDSRKFSFERSIESISVNASDPFNIISWKYTYVPDLSKCKNLRTIGVGAFRRCLMHSSITTLTIPASVRVIEDYAFANITNLYKVVFEEGSQIEYLGEKAFFGCNHLYEVEFPVNTKLTRIKYMAFAFTKIRKVSLTNLVNLKIVEPCAFLPCQCPFPGVVYSVDITAPTTTKIFGNLLVKERFRMLDTGIVFSSTLKARERGTKYKNLKLSSDGTIEDLMILKYLEYLNSDNSIDDSDPGCFISGSCKRIK